MESPARNRIEAGLSNEDYHAHPALSSSQLKYGYNNIELFRAAVIEKSLPPLSSKAMTLGTQFHEMVLEPEIFQPHIYGQLKIDRRKKEYKEFLKKFEIEDETQVLSLTELRQLEDMEASLLSHPSVPDFSKTTNELSVFYSWQGLELRVRPDALCVESQVIYDLKTTAKPVGASDFLRHADNFDYDLSAAMYTHALSCHYGKPFSFCFVVVQSVPPYSTAIYWVGDSLFYQGFSKYKIAVAAIKKARESGSYRLQDKAEVLDTYRTVVNFDATQYHRSKDHLKLGE